MILSPRTLFIPPLALQSLDSMTDLPATGHDYITIKYGRVRALKVKVNGVIDRDMYPYIPHRHIYPDRGNKIPLQLTTGLERNCTE